MNWKSNEYTYTGAILDELNPKQINLLKDELEELEAELQKQLDRATETTSTVTLDQSLVGRVSRMDALQQQSVALSTRNFTSKKLHKVTAALRSIEAGEYGFCKRCDEEIGFSRLQAQPEANLCIHCQDSADNQ